MGAPTITPLHDVTPDPPKKVEHHDRSYLSSIYPSGERDMLYARNEHELPRQVVRRPKIIPKIRGRDLLATGAQLVLPFVVLDIVITVFIAPHFWGAAVVFFPFLTFTLIVGVIWWWVMVRKCLRVLNAFNVNPYVYVLLYGMVTAALLQLVRAPLVEYIDHTLYWALIYATAALAVGAVVLWCIGGVDRRLGRTRH